jgi:hypothetical protein
LIDFDVHLRLPDDLDILQRLSSKVKIIRLDYYTVNEGIPVLEVNNQSETESLKISPNLNEY